MKQYEKDEYQAYLNIEKATIAAIKKTYEDALEQVDEKIRVLSTRTDIENMPTIIHQKKYQEQIKGQLEDILGKLQEKQYKTVNDYLNDCYSESFLRTMYSLNQQGIPFVWPIDQKAVERAVVLDSKISGGLYTRLGVDVKNFKKSISSEISRGIASSLSYSEIARNLKNASSVPISNASRIVRTEGHRIQNQAKLDTMDEAKKKGADVVKQWDSTLDGNTRPTHRQLDGQIRELDEDFEVDGMHASAPGMFGAPSEDCNCRCAVLQRAKWALDENELETLQKRAEYYGLDKTDDFNDFKEKYLKAADEESKGVDSDSVRSDAQKISNKSTSQEKAEDNEQQKLEDESLEWYVSGDGMWINQYLRGNGDFGELSEQEKAMLDAIDKATKSEIVKENVLYRSVDASAVFGDITDTQYENMYNALKYNDEYAKKQTDRLLDNALNKEFTEKGFMSTTKSEEFAMEFADFTGSEKPMVIKYNVPEGINGKDLAKFDIEGDEQYEVLLAKDQKYKITSLTAKDGNIIAEADLIPDENILENIGKSSKIELDKGQKKPFTKVKVEDIPSMNEQQFLKMKNNLEIQGIKVIQDADGDAYLKAMGAEAMTLSDGSAVIFQSGRVPSASAVFEEIIHTTQIKNNGMIGMTGDANGTIEYLNREIEANEKLLKYSDAYKLTEKDVESVKENLEMYYRKLKEVK